MFENVNNMFENVNNMFENVNKMFEDITNMYTLLCLFPSDDSYFLWFEFFFKSYVYDLFFLPEDLDVTPTVVESIMNCITYKSSSNLFFDLNTFESYIPQLTIAEQINCDSEINWLYTLAITHTDAQFFSYDPTYFFFGAHNFSTFTIYDYVLNNILDVV